MKLSQWLDRKSRAEENGQVKIVRASDMFDERWYVSQYQDVFKKLKDPVRHYCLKGWRENRDPSENFSTAGYLRKHPECEICPLVFEHNRNGYVDLSICAIMKNEAPYVKEWLDYHLSVGVKRFYIYDNESTDNLKEILTPYIAKGLVVYKYYPGEAKQMRAYNECIREYKDNTEWLAIIDADEFIIPVEKKSIPAFLKEFDDCPGVGINWICYDSNGHKTKPEGGVMESYTRVHYDEQFSSNHHIKSIVRPAMVDVYVNPYYARYKDDRNAVDENGNEIQGCIYREVHPKAFTDTVSVNKIRVNHYYSKSEEEYKEKLARGRALTKSRNKQFSAKSLIFDDGKYDCSAYRYVKRIHPELSQKLKIKALWYGIKNFFIDLRYYHKPCRLFDYIDEKWYFEQYPDAKKSGMTALQHYLSVGWKEGKNPSKYFDTNFYLNRYSDIAEAGVNPLIHYINFGKSAGRLPKAGKILFAGKGDDLHIIISKVNKKSKDYQLLDASELFDKDWYIKTYLNGQEDIDSVAHYMSIGWSNGCNPSEKFDTDFYLKKYKDVAKTGSNPLVHYIKHGLEEGRLPKSPYNCWQSFWQCVMGKPTDDINIVPAEKITEEYTIIENSELFNQKWYARRYLQSEKVNPIEHYLTVGWKSGYNPSTKFSTAEYLKQYPECEICPLVFEHNRNGYVDLSICAIMKNEAPYVKEWLDYHLSVGVKRFYIYDNESTDNLKEILTPYIAKGLVVYKYYPGVSRQISAYNECIKEYKAKNEWIAFIDVDEFMVPMEKETVPEFLQDYKEYPAVEVNWVYYDSNGYVSKPASGVLESYTRRQYEIQSLKNHRGKSIVQPAMCERMKSHVGYYSDGKSAVTENKEETHSRDFIDYVSVDKIRLNHYYCKSKEEAEEKIGKGNVANVGNTKRMNPQDVNFPQYIYDCTIFKYLARLHPEKSGRYMLKEILCNIKNVFIRIKHAFLKDTINDYVNEKWYFAKYPEAKASGLSAIKHYLTIGWKLGYNPSEMFDTEFYLKKYPDIAETGHNPLLHYITYGKNVGRLPKADNKTAKAQVTKQQVNVIEVKSEEINAKKTRKTDYEILESSGLFDKQWYVKTYLAGQEDADPIKHYLSFGWKNGFNPSKSFDTEFYLKNNRDVARTGHNPLLHYVKHGMEEGRLPKSPYGWLYRLWQGTFFCKEHFISEYGVTVIVPTYNRKAYLEKALKMLKSQTLSTVNFILVDDGSTDGSADYIKEATKDDKRFTLLRNAANQGPSAARNKAFNLVKTEYIGFFDIDDEIPDDYFEKLYLQAVKNSADIIFTNYNKEQHRIKKISDEADKYQSLRNGAIWDKLYSTALLKKNGIKFAEKLYTADNLFNIEAFHAADKIVLVDEPRYSYELHKDSIGKDEKRLSKRKKDIISICDKAIDFAEENEFDMAACAGLYCFLRRTYDCYAKDADFQKKLDSVLKRTGFSVKVTAFVGKYSKKEYDLVKTSELFNSSYYVRHTPQLWFSSVNPVEHYLTLGWLEGKNPSAEFDGNRYLELNEDVSVFGMNPLLHYIEHGKEEARSYEPVKRAGEKIRYALTYPIRVKEEYDSLLAEIKALENMK